MDVRNRDIQVAAKWGGSGDETKGNTFLPDGDNVVGWTRSATQLVTVLGIIQRDVCVLQANLSKKLID